MRTLQRIAMAVLLLGVALQSVWSQPRQAITQAVDDPDSFYGKDSNEGVYVRDSAAALEKLALAQRMERLKEWDKAADILQEVMEKYPDRVVQSAVDKD